MDPREFVLGGLGVCVCAFRVCVCVFTEKGIISLVSMCSRGHCGSLFMGIMTLLFLDRGAHAAARGALEGDGRRLDRESLQYINHLGGEHSVVTGRRPHMAANTGHLARSSSSYMICKKGGGLYSDP